MSVPLQDYVCSACALHGSAGGIPGSTPVYALGGGNVAPLKTRAAWCEMCQTVTRAEALPRNPHAVATQLAEARTASTSYVDDDDPFMREISALNARYVASADAWQHWAVERSGTGERCLSCGSVVPELEVLEGDAAWPTRFVHPGCGGVVSAVDSDLRVDWCFDHLTTIAFGRGGRSLDSDAPP